MHFNISLGIYKLTIFCQMKNKINKKIRSVIFPLQAASDIYKSGTLIGRGRSSGVERYLAKVNVESSNLFARSKYSLAFHKFKGHY